MSHLPICFSAVLPGLKCEHIFIGIHDYFFCSCGFFKPPLWSGGQSSWLQIQRSRVRFPASPDFLSSGSGSESTQLREYN
jgi:hypothetical protein